MKTIVMTVSLAAAVLALPSGKEYDDSWGYAKVQLCTGANGRGYCEDYLPYDGDDDHRQTKCVKEPKRLYKNVGSFYVGSGAYCRTSSEDDCGDCGFGEVNVYPPGVDDFKGWYGQNYGGRIASFKCQPWSHDNDKRSEYDGKYGWKYDMYGDWKDYYKRSEYDDKKDGKGDWKDDGYGDWSDYYKRSEYDDKKDGKGDGKDDGYGDWEDYYKRSEYDDKKDGKDGDWKDGGKDGDWKDGGKNGDWKDDGNDGEWKDGGKGDGYDKWDKDGDGKDGGKGDKKDDGYGLGDLFGGWYH